ncbi:MAG: prepilin-type N-terminal cleavage/methylation domain-containing protein [Clostridia bacterium]|nr:prepilin-type N-terminal cleavage/methylation domain-containing protein [Clostridia bacterium]
MLFKGNKKGFTLYELTIVIALIAIISTLVVTFVAYLTSYRNKVQGYNDAMDEIYIYKSAVEKWFSRFDTAEYSYTYAEDNGTYKLTANPTDTSQTTTYSVYYADSCIYLEYEYDSNFGDPDDIKGINILTLTAEYITGITFVSYDTTDDLWKCTVYCDSGNVSFLLERHITG